jgi:hypothetical protein
MFLKPTAAFKLDQQTKRSMATIVDPHDCGAYKRSMIEAQLASLIQPRVVKAKREEKGSE